MHIKPRREDRHDSPTHHKVAGVVPKDWSSERRCRCLMRILRWLEDCNPGIWLLISARQKGETRTIQVLPGITQASKKEVALFVLGSHSRVISRPVSALFCHPACLFKRVAVGSGGGKGFHSRPTDVSFAWRGIEGCVTLPNRRTDITLLLMYSALGQSAAVNPKLGTRHAV